MTKYKPPSKSKLERQLEGVCLDAPARIGGTVFAKGVPVMEMVQEAQRNYIYKSPQDAACDKPAGDPWIKHICQITTDWHMLTGKKIVINDLLEAFMSSGIKDIAIDDREIFEKRLMERLV